MLKPTRKLSVLISKRCVSRTSEVWADCDNSDFDGNTILLGSVDEVYIFISGFNIIKFSREDKIINYISILDGNMNACTIAVGERYTYFICKLYNFLENNEIEEIS